METISALLAICAVNSPVPDEFPAQRPMTRSFDVVFDMRLNEWLSKQPWDSWYETPSRPLWRHSNVKINYNELMTHQSVENDSRDSPYRNGPWKYLVLIV